MGLQVAEVGGTYAEASRGPAARPDLRFIARAVVVAVDAALEQIAALAEPPDGDASGARQAIRDQAIQIHLKSGTFGLAPVGVGAFMLVRYLDLLRASHDWDQEGVQVHVDALRTLRGGVAPDDARTIFAGLEALSDRQQRRWSGDAAAPAARA